MFPIFKIMIFTFSIFIFLIYYILNFYILYFYTFDFYILGENVFIFSLYFLNKMQFASENS